MLREYVPVLMIFALSLGAAVVMVLGSHIFSNRRPTPIKAQPYESGIPPLGDTRERFAVKYYVVAMLFLLFDVEVVVLFTWAIVFRQLGLGGFVAISIFLLLLIIGLVYEWKKGALEWEQ
jgi:NADH-quinone oxidoreductase subunit A